MKVKRLSQLSIPFDIGIASVNMVTKQIIVSPNFYLWDRKIQDFIMFQLDFLSKGCSYNEADSKAIEKVMHVHSDIKKSWLIKSIANIFLLERPNDFNLQRIKNLIQK